MNSGTTRGSARSSVVTGILRLRSTLTDMHVALLSLELEPGAARRDQLAHAQVAAAGRVLVDGEVDARRAHQLARRRRARRR